MSLNACQQAVAAYLNGLTCQGYSEPMEAAVRLPVAKTGSPNRPLAYIWGGTSNEDRLAIPRAQNAVAGTAGWKEARRTISVWVYGFELANDQTRTWKFPVLIDTISATLRSVTPMPAQLTDPQTGAVSYLLDLGETIDTDYDIDRTTGPQNTVRNLCRLDVSVREEFQA